MANRLDASRTSSGSVSAQSKLSTTAVCISRNSETWDISEIPFCNYTAGWQPFKHEQTKERVAYLAARRNAAVTEALRAHPETGHVLMIDSYYIHQEERIRGLMHEYEKMTSSDYSNGCILGASTWVLDKTHIRPKLRFYDGWTTPEANPLNIHEVEQTGGIMKVRSVGACYVFPRKVWEKTPYDVPEDLHGCEHNWMCEHSGLPVFLSLNERFWREPVTYPWLKRVRVSLHLGRFIG